MFNFFVVFSSNLMFSYKNSLFLFVLVQIFGDLFYFCLFFIYINSLRYTKGHLHDAERPNSSSGGRKSGVRALRR